MSDECSECDRENCVEDRCHINRLNQQVKDLTKQLALYREYVVADMEVTKHIPETPTHTKSGGYRDSEHRRAHSVAWTRKHAAMAALPEDKTDG